MKKIILLVLSFILVLGLGIVIGLNFPKNNTDDIKEENNQVNLNTEIKNTQVKEIFNIIKNNSWYPNYLEEELSSIKDDILLSMVARSYNKEQIITNDMYETIKEKNGNDYAMIHDGTTYVDVSSDEIINKTNEIFNKNITKEKLIKDNLEYGICTSYVYNHNIDKFLACSHCGGGIEDFTEKVYKYEELPTEINVYTVVATTKFDEERDWVYFDKENNLYDFIGFEITPENYDKFYHLKYTFIQKQNGNYYISDIEKI